MSTIIVSRHAGGIAFIRAERPEFAEAPVLDGAITADDVRGMHVVGNLPLHLAALAASYTRVEFDGPPPGREYDLTAEQMRDAGARLVTYIVRTCHPAATEVAIAFEEALSLPRDRYTEDDIVLSLGAWAQNYSEEIRQALA